MREREKYYIHPPIIETSRGRIIAQNIFAQKFSILFITPGRRRTATTRTLDDTLPSLPPSLRLVFPPLCGNRIRRIYIYIYARVVLHNAHQRNETWSVAAPLFTTEKHPFPLLSVEGRASTESFTLPTTISSPLCGRQARKYSARQTKSRNVARAFRLTDNFPSAERAPTTCVIIVNGRKECGGREGNGLADGRTLDMDEERFGILEYNQRRD